MTKVWPHKQYPLRKAGRMVLDHNPRNWFAEIEQAAFSPSQMVPGIEMSPDPMLQARIFAYPDASRYRLGVNYQFLPTNAPISQIYCPTERDGFMNFTKNYAGDSNYVGSKLKPMKFSEKVQSFAQNELSEDNQLKRDNGKGEFTQRTNGIFKPKTLDHTRSSLPVVVATQVTDKDFEQATAL